MVKKEKDKNMVISSRINRPGIKFYDIECAPIRLYGVFREGDHLARLPMEVANKTVNSKTPDVCCNSTGGRVRFITDSPYVAIRVTINDPYVYPPMPISGSLGLDCYVDGEFTGAFVPPLKIEDNIIESVVNLGDCQKRLVTVNLPQYTGVVDMYIGIDGDCSIEPAPDYKLEKPIVFYGSSITNGACASRPGMSYENILSRWLGFNYINLGFGGCAKGEVEMAEYIASLDMSAFVLDYDHNAPTPTYLDETHERFYKIVREKHPDLPIIMLSRPSAKPVSNRLARFEVIKKTYDNAKARGERVWLIDGSGIFPEDILYDCTADNVHPSDLGFYFMARALRSPITEALGL